MENSIRVSEPYLRRWYAAYRRKYFSNKLPLPSEVEIYYDEMPGLQAECDDEDMPHNGEFILRINATWRDHPEIARLWLLHEMAHMHLWPYGDHGKKWQDEMLRLATAGAFRKIW